MVNNITVNKNFKFTQLMQKLITKKHNAMSNSQDVNEDWEVTWLILLDGIADEELM